MLFRTPSVLALATKKRRSIEPFRTSVFCLLNLSKNHHLDTYRQVEPVGTSEPGPSGLRLASESRTVGISTL